MSTLKRRKSMSFLRQQADPSRPDGYWLGSYPYSTTDSKCPHLIGYGLGTSDADSKIILYLNPYNASTPSPAGKDAPWEKREVAVLQFPVAAAHADIAGNGLNDIILTDEYGPSLDDIWAHGGRVSWFENSGNINDNAHWRRRFIGKSPSMHRIYVGHFSRTDRLQLVGAPVVKQSGDRESPAPVIIYTAPDDPSDQPVDDDRVGWETEVPFPETFRLVHEVFIFRREDALDQIVLAGREGVSLIWYERTERSWKTLNLGTGLPRTPGNPYWGSGSVAVATVGNDRAAYIAAGEAFHGNVVSVYIKPPSSPQNTLSGVNWTRVVLDDFGTLNAHNTGSIHHIGCVDIDGDGVDETLVALVGSDPPTWRRTGVWCYKPIDLEKGQFIKFKLSDDSAARIAFGDFTGRGLTDFATISYSVPGYFESPNPSVNVFASSPITAHKLNDEVLLLIPNPSEIQLIDEVEFLDVSSRKLSLVVLPPETSFIVERGAGVKVILGQLSWLDPQGRPQSRTQATLPFSAVSNIVTSITGDIESGPAGAAFMLLKKSSTSGQPPYSDMSQLVAHNIFPPRFPADVRNMEFPWVKVEDRPWANGRFKGLEFYNLVGFQVKLQADSLQQICHIQLWTAGVGVSAGFHNHIGEIFCEIHSCIVNGTGQGGMSWATVPDDLFDPNNPDPSKYDSLVVGDMHEHGPLWRTDEDGLPQFRTNASVNYPWHAWIAGQGTTQSFDVWLAFEFPPLTTVSERQNSLVPAPGVYRLFNSSVHMVLAAVENGDSTDGTYIIPEVADPTQTNQQWQIANVPGTQASSLKNEESRSFATSNWPPVDGQRLVGSRSPAVLGTTSNWIFTSYGQGLKIFLIGTNLVWALRDDLVVLETEQTGNANQIWNLQPVT